MKPVYTRNRRITSPPIVLLAMTVGLAIGMNAMAAEPRAGSRGGGAELTTDQVAPLVRFMNERVAAHDVLAATVAVSRQGRPAWLAAFGHFDDAAKRPLTTDAVFDLGELTQPVTAVAALQLQEAGRWLLSDPVVSLLPRLSASSRVSLFDLMRQVDGLPDVLELSSAMPGDPKVQGAGTAHRLRNSARVAQTFTGDDFITRIARQTPRLGPGLQAAPGFSYDVLGLAVEAAARQTLGAVLLREIFIPLDMWDTGFNPPAELHSRVAWREAAHGGQATTSRDPRRAVAFECGGACLTGSAPDYLRLVNMLLAGGTANGHRLLSRGSVAMMTSDQLGSDIDNRLQSLVGDDPTGPSRTGYGLGVSIRTAGSTSSLPGSVGEYGVASTTGSFVWVDPVRELGFVMLAVLPDRGNDAEWSARRLQRMVLAMLKQVAEP